MNQEMILILDFGGQYNQLIARRVRDLGVYCEIIPFRTATAFSSSDPQTSDPPGSGNLRRPHGLPLH